MVSRRGRGFESRRCQKNFTKKTFFPISKTVKYRSLACPWPKLWPFWVLLLSYNCTAVRRNAELLRSYDGTTEVSFRLGFNTIVISHLKPRAKFSASECHSLRVSHWTHCIFSPNLFHNQIICFCICLFVWTRVILFQIKSSSLYEKSMNSPIVFKLKTQSNNLFLFLFLCLFVHFN